jgi:acetylornithine/succinyldiaminopimelate/putrescine aminotransferase
MVAGLEPDIMSMVKALGAGHPLGAIAVSDRVDNALELGDHFNTFMGNLVSCAAGLAGLNILIRERLYENVAKQGAVFISVLKESMEEIPVPAMSEGWG